MIQKLLGWLFDGGGPEKLPERVSSAIRQQQERSEILIGWIQLVIVLLVTGLYEGTNMAEGLVQEDYSFELEVLLIYAGICIIRIALAHGRLLKTWMLYLSVVADMVLLMGLIYSFHLKYAQPAVFYLKVPTPLYVFLFIALRALRFEARLVMFAGFCAAAGWAWRWRSRAPATCWSVRSRKVRRPATCRAFSIPASPPASVVPRCRSRPAKASCAMSPS